MDPKVNYFVSSIISSIVTKTVISPLERLKNLQQSEKYYKHTKYQNGLISNLKYMYASEGIKGFFKGNLINIYSKLPVYSFKFPLNDILGNAYRKKKKGNLNFTQKLLLGTTVGYIQLPISYPIDVIKSRIYLDNSMSTIKNNKIFNYTMNMIKLEGYMSIYKGFLGSSISYPLYIGLQMSIFYELRSKETNIILSGALAGLVAQTTMYPADTIKKHLQLNGIHSTEKKYNSIRGCIRFIYKSYGITGFYTGLKTNIVKSVPGAVIQFYIYENLKKTLSKI